MAGLKRLAEAERIICGSKASRSGSLALANYPKKRPSNDGNIRVEGERNMLFTQKVIVRKYERGLLFKDGDFIQFLEAGTYRFFGRKASHTVDRYDLSIPAFNHRLTDFLVETEKAEIERLFHVIETHADEVAVIYLNDQVAELLGPAQRKLYWKGVVKVQVERFNLSENLALDSKMTRRLIQGRSGQVLPLAANVVYARFVPDGHAGLLYVDGELVQELPAGLHAYWNVNRAVVIEPMDLRIRVLEVQGQEILTKDKVALRINATVTYQFTDAVKAVRACKDPLDHLYKEVQFGLRAAVGTRKLDTLLEDKTAIDHDVAEHLAGRFPEIGLGVVSVGVKDIILPGEMKDLLGKVVEAEKAAQANVIRRREETNATRSLLNTAKVMESNSIALRLKELETVEKVTENVGNLSVVGGLDALLNGLVDLKQ